MMSFLTRILSALVSPSIFTVFRLAHHIQSSKPVEKFIEKNRLPHLLFYGPPGTGKTSTILAVARKIYGGAKERTIRNNVLEVRAGLGSSVVVPDKTHSLTRRTTVASTSCARRSKTLPACASRSGELSG